MLKKDMYHNNHEIIIFTKNNKGNVLDQFLKQSNNKTVSCCVSMFY